MVHDYLPQDKLQKDAHIWVGPDIADIPLFTVTIWDLSGSYINRPIWDSLDIAQMSWLSGKLGHTWVRYGHAYIAVLDGHGQ